MITPLKRYALFVFSQYYPSGGWDDLAGTYDTVEEAKTAVKLDYYREAHIVDLATGEKISAYLPIKSGV